MKILKIIFDKFIFMNTQFSIIINISKNSLNIKKTKELKTM